MTAVVIEHVEVSELPEAWRAQLHATENARVTVRIEEEVPGVEMPAFGMWQDKEEAADVAEYVRRLRAARLARD